MRPIFQNGFELEPRDFSLVTAPRSSAHCPKSPNQLRARAKNNERADILPTSTVSLPAAIIGGWIAGKYALRAQKQAAEDQRQRDLSTALDVLAGPD